MRVLGLFMGLASSRFDHGIGGGEDLETYVGRTGSSPVFWNPQWCPSLENHLKRGERLEKSAAGTTDKALTFKPGTSELSGL